MIEQEDSGYSPQEVRELMIPSDLAIPGHYFVPLKEVTDVLQTDLLFPITKQDQLVNFLCIDHFIFVIKSIFRSY